jgi:putative oxidoreductase
MNEDIGLLILRVVIGLLLAGHGVQKLSFRLGGNGLRGSSAEFAADGFAGGVVTALLAGVSQLGSGLFLTFGALVPLAATAAIAVMTVALIVKIGHGLWVQNDGFEYPLVLIAAIATLAIAGPGRLSIDHLLHIDHLPLWVGSTAIILGILSALVVRLALTAKPERNTYGKEI